jgi:hypothetical protein
VAFSRDAHAPPLVKNQALNMALALSPVMGCAMVSYIENPGIEKYLLLFFFSYCYISFSILLMFSKKKK